MVRKMCFALSCSQQGQFDLKMAFFSANASSELLEICISCRRVHIINSFNWLA